MDREVYMKIEEICTIVFLAVNAWTDYRKKKFHWLLQEYMQQQELCSALYQNEDLGI